MSPHLVLQLRDVKVQPGMHDYSVNLGCDVLRPGEFLRGVAVTPAVGVEWRLKSSLTVWTPTIKVPAAPATNAATTTASTTLATTSTATTTASGSSWMPPPPRAPGAPPSTTYTTSPVLSAPAKKLLMNLASARDEDIKRPADTLPPLSHHVQQCKEAEQRMEAAGVPGVLVSALGRCLFRRYVRQAPSVHDRFSIIMGAYE